jgi:hypothetical protein
MTAEAITPPQIFTTDQRLSILIHAETKRGKSSLSSTAPKPVLVLDAEGSWRFINMRKIYWNPQVETPPVYDGTWDACIVHVREWATVDLVYQYLLQWPLPFVSVVIDSITEVQRRCKANLKGTDAMRIQDWGVLLSVMDATIRGFRDLTLMPNVNVRCVVFISETRTNEFGKMVPYLQGQIATSLPYWCDVCLFLRAEYETDNNGQATKLIRRGCIEPNDRYEAGQRVGGVLGECITLTDVSNGVPASDIETWMKIIFAPRTIPPVTTQIPMPPIQENTQ